MATMTMSMAAPATRGEKPRPYALKRDERGARMGVG
jgi:hypothetical protein